MKIALLLFSLLLLIVAWFCRLRRRPIAGSCEGQASMSLNTLLDQLPFAIYWKDRDSTYLGCNAEFARRAGVDTPAEIVGKTDQDLAWSGSEAIHYREQDRQVVTSGNPRLNIQEPLSQSDGSIAVVYKSKVPLRDAGGNIIGVLGGFADVTERQRGDDELRQVRARLEEAERIGCFGHWEWDLATGRVYWSKSLLQLLGIDLQQLGLEPTIDLFRERVHPDDWPEVKVAMQAALAGEQPYRIEHRVIMFDGQIRHFYERGEVLRDPAGNPYRMVGTAQDITERKLAETKVLEQAVHLNYLTQHDTLTGLANRSLFLDRLEHALELARRGGVQLAVLVLDLDRFKSVNDTLGPQIGDLLLKKMANRIQSLVRESDTVARLGGDEFAILIENLDPNEGVGPVAVLGEKLLAAMRRPMNLEEHELFLAGSIGISIAPADADGVEALMQYADVAMSRARRLGGNQLQFYTAEMDRRARELLLLEGDLRRGIDQGQLTVFYQPQLDLISERLIGFEALVRWRHPERGMVSPADFIPLAEETGLIIPLGEQVLRAACTQVRAWHAQGNPGVRVAVNLSARQFAQQNLVAMIDAILLETGLDPCWLELEITESAIMDNVEAAVATLTQLKNRGISLAIDDFGTGYSSLGYLRRFPLDKLKIDQSFIRNVVSDPSDAALATSIIALAQNMKLQVLAEGIETREQLHFLLSKGCGAGQGYLFSRPLPPAELGGFFSGSAGGCA
jgi:diguanylate cyclase (GGDEF)-like protein/PAS domain S-box-containing protein